MRPYHAAGGGEGRPRLLLISYHSPPATTAGALRWQRLMPLLAEQGWAFDVVSEDPARLPAPDLERLGELPPGTRLFGVRPSVHPLERLDAIVGAVRRQGRNAGGPPSLAAGLAPAGRPESLAHADMRWWPPTRDTLRRTYGMLLFHAREAEWARAAARLARLVAADGRARGVIASGPPHLAHLAGRRVAAAMGVPLVLDYRDPWSTPRRLPEAYATPLYFMLARRTERAVVRRADLLVTTTHAISAALRAAYPAARVVTVMNGCDAIAAQPARGDGRFRIVYAGNIYLDRDPRPLFQAAARLAAEARLTPAQLAIELVGDVMHYGGRPTAAIAAEQGLEAFVTLRRSVAQRELSAILAGASVLVSLPQDSQYAIPSKIFEYMGYAAWLLVLSPPGTPTADLLTGTEAAVVSPGDVDRLHHVLRDWHAAFTRGTRPVPLAAQGRFSRRAQAAILGAALEEVLGSPAPAAPIRE